MAEQRMTDEPVADGDRPFPAPPPRPPSASVDRSAQDSPLPPPPPPPLPDATRVVVAPALWHPLWGTLVSMAVHLTLLLLLALCVWRSSDEPVVSVIQVRPPTAEEVALENLQPPEELVPVDEVTLSVASKLELDVDLLDELTEVPISQDLSAAPLKVERQEFSDQAVPRSDLMQEVGALAGAALEGRGAAVRGQMVAKYGGSEGSERAVVMALKWFAAHQNRDGSWTLDQRRGPCKGKCTQHGLLDKCHTGATALALLPFLGAGQTHQQGEYKETVSKGLRFLLRTQDRNGSLVSGGGSMYSHGLSTIALCEAYAMTSDEFLKAPAEAALNYVAWAQDPRGGGWRYLPQQPGDTSAVAWQLMAVKSGHMASLPVPKATYLRVGGFLDSVQSDGGAMYGYNSVQPRPSTTAAGLLCRIYMGWKREEPALVRGIEHLSQLGPAHHEGHAQYHMYYNYYATQVLRHYGGSEWEAWNEEMRDFLVRTQQRTGHMAGSWDIPDFERPAHDAEMGGRLYYTSLATMILEVYYRYMPIYGEGAGDDFPL